MGINLGKKLEQECFDEIKNDINTVVKMPIERKNLIIAFYLKQYRTKDATIKRFNISSHVLGILVNEYFKGIEQMKRVAGNSFQVKTLYYETEQELNSPYRVAATLPKLITIKDS